MKLGPAVAYSEQERNKQESVELADGPWTDDELRAMAVIASSRKVSVSEVQRKLCISYNSSQKLCQSIVDSGFANGLPVAPSISRTHAATQERSKQDPVFLVATGEVHEGQETYTRHDVRPPLCDAETLYVAPVDQQAEIERLRGALLEVHNCGANWSGQTMIRKALEKK
jgi:hypothetical protein